jgi:DNA-binding IscR family transcriptional regulator
MLAKSPHDITIGDIITTMEGPIALVDCLLNSEGEENPCCEKAVHCMTRDVWAKVCEGLSNVLNAITLADLCHKDEKGETAK